MPKGLHRGPGEPDMRLCSSSPLATAGKAHGAHFRSYKPNLRFRPHR
jgi:hypothetical protein